MSDPFTRKVMSNQFVITLPGDWRKHHSISKGDAVSVRYIPASVLVIIAKNHQVHPLEDTLIELLINLPSDLRNRELLERLQTFVEEYRAQTQVDEEPV